MTTARASGPATRRDGPALVAPLLDLFGRVDAKTLLETERGRVMARVVREQVGGEETGREFAGRWAFRLGGVFEYELLDGEATVTSRGESALDTIIATVAHECMIVTGDEKDFSGLQIVNPMRRAG